MSAGAEQVLKCTVRKESMMAIIHELKLPVLREESINVCRGSIFFVGTATVIIKHAGFTILTDPNFLHSGDHVHLGYGLTSRRLTNPAIDIDELPPLDFCILSHFHGDHFDRIAVERLDKSLPIMTTPEAAKALEARGFRRLFPLRTWDTMKVTKAGARVMLTSMPGKHAPGLLSRLLPSVMGSMLEFGTTRGASPFNLYISGDTLVIDELREIPKRYPEIDLALMHLGGTKILRLLTVTMDAEQGVEALKIIRPHAAIPIHYNDYTVFKSPLSDFKRAVEDAKLPVQIIYLSHGETYDFEVRVCGLKAV
jgi:L-ascorbate metabolism protein UlaG (beta-lactamase superfamily)